MNEKFSTKIVKVNSTKNHQYIKAAVEFLKQGIPIAFPTETVYGLGASAFDQAAIERIFKIKGRPQDNPLIVHVANQEMVSIVAQINPQAEKLMEVFWPGPLTLILPKKEGLAPSVSAGLDSVGVRMPDHPIALNLIEAFGQALAAPSANISGKPSPTKAQHVWADLQGKVPLILDGGATEQGVESTVLDLSSDQPAILRPGVITFEMLSFYLPDLEEAEARLRDEEAPLSPGMKYRHYAPQAQINLYWGEENQVCSLMAQHLDQAQAQDKKTAVIITSFPCQLEGDLNFNLYSDNTDQMLAATAKHLFEYFRLADAQGVDLILLQGVIEKDLGRALMNRMRKAAKERYVFE